MPSMENRRDSGIFYTPQRVARYIVEQAFDYYDRDHASRVPAILDPACGDGVFLREAYLRLAGRQEPNRRMAPAELATQIYGVDSDRQAVRAAIRSLTKVAGCNSSIAGQQVLWGDALVSDRLSRASAAPAVDWSRRFTPAAGGAGFDIIVGNPPYVNIRRLARSQADVVRAYLRNTYRCARGAFDIYVLFIELAQRLLRPGGIGAMIVPNKIATMEYALACRELLLSETTLLQITDVSHLRPFREASVYPHILVWKKSPAAADHQITVRVPNSLAELDTGRTTRRVLQHAQQPARGWAWHGSLEVETRVATKPLDELCRLHSGTTGFVAKQLSEQLVDNRTARRDDDFDFIVSGNIDRYRVRLGQVRFMKRVFQQPRLPAGCAQLTSRKRALYRLPKIVIAGMTRRLEAAWDPGGLSLGVQVFAAAELQDDPMFLLGVLNSKLLSHLFRLRYQAKRLAGGYLAINLGQLAKLPICQPDAATTRRLSELGAQRLRLAAEVAAAKPGRIARVERAIDQLVYKSYCLRDHEIAAVEAAVES